MGPDAPSRMSEDALLAIARKKYRKVSDNYNALYESARRSDIVSQGGDIQFTSSQ